MVRSTLRLSRVELNRAGITPAIRNVLMEASLQERAARIHPRHIFAPFHPPPQLFVHPRLTSYPPARIIMVGSCARDTACACPAGPCGLRPSVVPPGGV